jgi:TorA maturation chaperone TorD
MVAQAHQGEDVEEMDLARARLYTLLAQMLARPPGGALLAELASLRGTPTPLGRALDELAARAAATTTERAEREHAVLFVGLERGELVPYASYYLTGFLHDRPLARLRRDMQALGLERLPGVAEPEDHIATVCEIMAGLIAGLYDAQDGPGEREFFRRHLAPWAGRFFADLERAGAAVLYRPLGTLGRLFMDIEDEAWAMAMPVPGGAERPGAARQDGSGG